MLDRDGEDSGQESSLTLLGWNVKAKQLNIQRQVLAIASEVQSLHFVASNDMQHHITKSSGNTGSGPTLHSEKCTRGTAGQ